MLRSLTPLLLVAVPVALVAAPVPKNEAMERVRAKFGEVVERAGCKLEIASDDLLTLRLDGYAPKTTKATECGVRFRRTVTGDFTATVHYAIKSDLVELRSTDPFPRLTVGWRLRGADATVWFERKHRAEPVVRPGGVVVTTAAFHTAVAQGGKGSSSATSSLRFEATGTQLRLTRAGDDLRFAFRDGSGEWRQVDEVSVPLGETVALDLLAESTVGEPVAVTFDQFVVK